MLGWMNDEALRRTLETGRTWFWSRSRQEYWCKGETSGDRQWVREARYDCDVDACCSSSSRRAGARATPASAAASSAPSAAAPRPAPSERGRPSAGPPSRDEFVALAREHTVVPVWREVLADLETPVSAFVKLVGAAERRPPGFLLESVEHAERWGRFSFIGRDPALTLVVRGQRGRVHRHGRRPGCRPTAVRSPRSRRCSRRTAHRASPSCRRSTAASSATSATTSCARSSTCPTCPPDDLGLARRGALGHRARHRVRPLPPAPLPDRERVPRPGVSDAAAARRLRRRVRRASAARVDELAPPAAVHAVAAARRASSPRCPSSRRRWRVGHVPRRGRGGARAHPRRRHLPGGARAALRPRRTRSTRSTCTGCCARSTRRRTCTSCATPRPRWSARRPSRWCSCSTAG